MNFNVSQLMMGPSGSHRVFDVDEQVPGDDDPDPQHVKGSARLLRTDSGIWVSAKLDSEIRCECVRCLAEYGQAIHIEVEEEFLPRPESGAGSDRLGDIDGEENFAIDQDHILDLTEVVRQYSALSSPMDPVCRRDCKGICASCGNDLNHSTCRCDTPSDSRWSPLANAVFPRDID